MISGLHYKHIMIIILDPNDNGLCYKHGMITMTEACIIDLYYASSRIALALAKHKLHYQRHYLRS